MPRPTRSSCPSREGNRRRLTELHGHGARRRRRKARVTRATFVTIALATGITETWVSDRTGHGGHSMIERYRRNARTWNLEELGCLPHLIPELAEAEPTVRIGPGCPLSSPHGWRNWQTQRI